MKVLLVEGEQHYSAWLVDKLSQAGFRLEVSAAAGLAGTAPASERAIATIIDLPGRGPEPSQLVRRLREYGETSPIMVISEHENWRAKVQSLDAGADDFLVKPVRSEEIGARLRALIRRAAGQSTDRLEWNGIELSMRQSSAKLHGELLDLTRNELRLLRHLMLWPDRTHSVEEISAIVQQGCCLTSANSVEVLIARLRKKIGRHRIRTVRGVGYRLEQPMHEEALQGPQPHEVLGRARSHDAMVV